MALSNCPFQALGITFFLGAPFSFHFVFPFFPFFLPLLYPSTSLFIYLSIIFTLLLIFCSTVFTYCFIFISVLLFTSWVFPFYLFIFFFVLLTSYRPLSFFSLYIYFYLCSYLLLQVTLLRRHKPPSTSIFLFMYTKFIMKTASILGFYSTSIGIQFLTFQRITVPSSSVLTVQVNIYQHLKRFLILKMEVLWSFKTSVTVYPSI